tara:strand:- start:693 stop:854 length:162 start_codon:yes stop_codon:yes gene_type:complete
LEKSIQEELKSLKEVVTNEESLDVASSTVVDEFNRKEVDLSQAMKKNIRLMIF